MGYQLTTKLGTIEAVIDDNCGRTKFYNIATTLTNDLDVKFSTKFDNVESIDWLFDYKGHPLALHYNIYNGVSICPESRDENEVVRELASILERKFY